MRVSKFKKIISRIAVLTAVGLFLFSAFISEAGITANILMIDDYNDTNPGKNTLGYDNIVDNSSSFGIPAKLSITNPEPFLHRYNWGHYNRAREIDYDMTNTGAWGYYSSVVWNYSTPLNLNALGLTHLSLRVKRELKPTGYTTCYLESQYGSQGWPNNYTSGRINLANYALQTEEWQLVNIPLSAFAGLDISKVQAVVFVFNNSLPVKAGILQIEHLQFSQGYGKPESTGVVRIDRKTKQLTVNGQPFNVKGVGYQPIPIGYSPPRIGTSAMCDRDFPQLVEMGCNTIRTWGEPGSAVMSKASEYGLKVIADFWMDTSRSAPYSDPTYRNTVKANFITFLNTYKNSSALLMWALGNENNYSNDPIEPFYTLCNELAQIAYQLEGSSYHPVMLVNGDLFYIGVRERQAEDLQLNYIDVWGANAYHGDFNSVNWTAIPNNWNYTDADYRDRGIDWFELYKEKSFKPLVITEYGSDAFHTTGLEPIVGYEDEDEQADFVRSNTLDIMDASDVCLGATLMAYSDEWWKDSSTGSSHSVQDLGPAYFWGDRLPDGYVNEEWWGVMKIARDGTWEEEDGLDDIKRRKVFNTLKLLFEGAKVVEPGKSIQAAINSASSGDTIYVIDGEFTEDDIYIGNKDDIRIIGDGHEDTIVNTNLIYTDSDSSVENLSILYKKGGSFMYSNAHYTDMELINDSGVTAVNSAVTVKNCVIMPDPATFGENKYGKGIQIWNLYGEPDIEPLIENNLILNGEAGIYLYSQASGGAILGKIKNNTFDMNDYGILLRMHKENPLIQNNIMTRSENAIHITYDIPYELLSTRLNNIRDNFFGREAFNNIYDCWLEQRKSGYRYALICPPSPPPDAPPDARRGSFECFYWNGNMDGDPESIQPYEYPDYIFPEDLDYTPQHPACSDKGCRLYKELPPY